MVLNSLQGQTLALGRWELVFVDNASAPAVKPELKWHPQARLIREETLGLTSARLRGISESRSELLVLVDDDTVLAPDYLEQALTFGRNWPMLGAWGGLILPKFEAEPQPWTQEFWPLLALRDFPSDYWSNLDMPLNKIPCGGGMCVRKSVAVAYADCVTRDPVRMGLDRAGTNLMSGGDTDLALTAVDLGLGIGMFRALKVSHLIPPGRLTEEYLLKLAESIHYSTVILQGRRNKLPSLGLPSCWRGWAGAIRRRLTMPSRNRRFMEAKMRGRQRAVQKVLSWGAKNTPKDV
jgi:glycosyltransferase involved in cell wall biosynthesis